MIVDGKWIGKFDPMQGEDAQGKFNRKASTFRNQTVFADKGRYILYVGYICPWAHRTLIARALNTLEEFVEVVVLDPALSEQGWSFGSYKGTTPDPIINARYMHELYTLADPSYSGRATIPVLWDKFENTIVNNESADILKIFNSGFGKRDYDLRPTSLLSEMDELNLTLYDKLNNGVYKTGFAKTQASYLAAVNEIFECLDDTESLLSDGRRYLLGDQLTETDIRLYATLIRFDIAYYGAFKCNVKRISDYSYVQAYLEALYKMDAFGLTTNFEHIKQGYYSIEAINPHRIVPKGPVLEWAQ